MKAFQIFLVICAFFCASIVLAGDVSVQNQPGTDFTKFKTFAWEKGNPAPNPMMDQFIVQSIEGKLTANGMTKATDNPDLLITYHVAVDQSVQWSGMGGFRGFGGSSGSVYKVYTGQLVINLIDPKGKMYVWQGTATDSVSQDASKTEKEIAKALDKMFSKFPQPPK